MEFFPRLCQSAGRLDFMSVPQDGRTCVLSPADQWGLLGSQTALYIGVLRIPYREGDLGRIGGVNTMMSQVVPTHTVGPLGGTPLVNGGSQT